MKTIIKILIALALVNASVRVGYVALNHYQLEDAAQQEVTFGENFTPAQLAERVIEKAVELEVPLGPEGIQVDRDRNRTIMTAAYTQPIELFPGYIYQAELSFTVEARSLRGL